MRPKTYLPVWHENIKVRSYDIGLNARMRMSSICSYFQEVAGNHATHLDLGYDYMQQTGRVWVLSRLFVTVHQMPAWRQELTFETWPLGVERIFFHRDYRILDGNTPMVSATSYWLLLDLKTRKPTVFPFNEKVLKANEGLQAMDVPSEGFHPVKSDMYEIHKVKYSDIDQNEHVNNARYVEWIFDQVDADILNKKSPAFFSIEYRHEVKAGDVVRLYKDYIGTDSAFAIEGRLDSGNQVCFKAKVQF